MTGKLELIESCNPAAFSKEQLDEITFHEPPRSGFRFVFTTNGLFCRTSTVQSFKREGNTVFFRSRNSCYKLEIF